MRKKEIRKINRVGNIIIVLCFFVPIYLFFIISIFDRDKTVSERENRTLSAFPKFSLSYLFKGNYTLDYENYYSDQFPLRDGFLSANSKIVAIYTNTYADKMSLVATTKKDDFAGESLRAVSGNVNINELLSSNTTNATNTTKPKDVQTSANTTAKEAPLPEEKTPTNVQQQGAILIADNRAMELYTNFNSILTSYADSISTLQSELPNAQVFNILAPTSVEFYSPEEYHTGSSSQKDGINTAYSALTNGAKGIDVYSELRKHIDEYIYFRTDHHWTAKGAYCAYVALSKAAGFDPVDIDSLQIGKLDDFVGTMYMYTQSEKLKEDPDYVEYFLPKVQTTAMVYNDSSMTNGFEISVITPNIETSNKYLTFIEGDNPLTYIKTNVNNGKKVLVVKESYGNSMVPFLCNNYEEVYVVDPRRIDMNLPEFINEKGIQQVVCVNYIFAPSNETFMNAFNKIINK